MWSDRAGDHWKNDRLNLENDFWKFGAQKRQLNYNENNALGCFHRNDIVIENENPATSAKVNGAKDVVTGVVNCGEYIAAFPILAMHWGALV